MNLKRNFGKKIKELRENRQFTQAEVAELIGVETLAISRIETGENFAKAETLEALKNAFNVQFKDLFDFQNEETANCKQKALIAHLKSLSDEDFDYFVKCIKEYKKIKIKSQKK